MMTALHKKILYVVKLMTWWGGGRGVSQIMTVDDFGGREGLLI